MSEQDKGLFPMNAAWNAMSDPLTMTALEESTDRTTVAYTREQTLVAPVVHVSIALRAYAELDATRAKLCEWYEADGTVTTLSPEVVVERRKAAARLIADLTARLAELEAWACESCGARFSQAAEPVMLEGVTRCSSCATLAEATRERDEARHTAETMTAFRGVRSVQEFTAERDAAIAEAAALRDRLAKAEAVCEMADALDWPMAGRMEGALAEWKAARK